MESLPDVILNGGEAGVRPNVRLQFLMTWMGTLMVHAERAVFWTAVVLQIFVWSLGGLIALLRMT